MKISTKAEAGLKGLVMQSGLDRLCCRIECLLIKKVTFGAGVNDSAVKSTCCSHRRPWFRYKHSPWNAQLSVEPEVTAWASNTNVHMHLCRQAPIHLK